MANILYRTRNGAKEMKGGSLQDTLEFDTGNSFPSGLKRSYSYIKTTPLSSSDIDANFYQLAAETVHQGYCDISADTDAKTVFTTYFPLETGARVSVRFIHANTAKNPTLTVYVPNKDDKGNYLSTSAANIKDGKGENAFQWIAYGPFPIFVDGEQMAQKSAANEVGLQAGVWYEFMYDDFEQQEAGEPDSKTKRVHRWKLITNNTVHKDGVEEITGLKLHKNHVGIGCANPVLAMENTDSGYSQIVFGKTGLTGLNANQELKIADSAISGRMICQPQTIGLSIRHSDDTATYGAASGKWTNLHLVSGNISQGNFESGYLVLTQNAGIPAGCSSPVFSLSTKLLGADGSDNGRETIVPIRVINTRSEEDNNTYQHAVQFGCNQTTFVVAGEIGASSNLPSNVAKMSAKNAAVYDSLDSNPPNPDGENLWLVSDTQIVFRPTACGNSQGANAIHEYMPTGWFASEVEPATATDAANAHVSMFGFSIDAFDQLYKDNTTGGNIKWKTAVAATSKVTW